MRRTSMPLAVLALVLAGCATPAATTEDAPSGMPLDEPFAPTDCRLGLVVFLIGMEQAQRSLPEGFRARDAQAVLGTPAPTGKGAALLANLVCDGASFAGEGYSIGEVLVAVHPPEVDAALEPSTLDYYSPAIHVGEGALREAFERAGWTLLPGELTLDVASRPVGGVASGALAHEGATVWSLSATGGPEVTVSALERIWHATPTGLAFLENEYSNRAYLGEASCALAAGTLAADVVGATSCRPGDAVGAVVPAQSWRARLVTLPGVFPA